MLLDQIPKSTVEQFGAVLRKHRYFQPEAESLLQYKFGTWATAFTPSYIFPYFKFILQKSVNSLSNLLLFFYCCQLLHSQLLKSILGEDLFDSLVKSEIIILHGEMAESKIQIIPFGKDLFITTEQPKKEEGNVQHFSFAYDAVMTLFPETYDLARRIECVKAATALDICCGNGVQAVLLARTVGRVVGIDINENALQYARFNAMLNGLDNVVFEQRDIRQPLGDLGRFEVIVTNPPFCPASEQKTLSCDGGTSGDNFIKILLQDRIGEVIEEHGNVYLVASLALREGETLAQKFADLNAGHLSCDVHFTNLEQNDSGSFGLNSLHSFAIYFIASKHGHNLNGYENALHVFLENLEQKGIKSMAYGVLQLDNVHLTHTLP